MHTSVKKKKKKKGEGMLVCSRANKLNGPSQVDFLT